MENPNIKDLENVLFQTVITALQQEPTAGWAQVARGLLADYRAVNEGSMPSIEAESIRSALSDSAPFKLNKSG